MSSFRIRDYVRTFPGLLRISVVVRETNIVQLLTLPKKAASWK